MDLNPRHLSKRRVMLVMHDLRNRTVEDEFVAEDLPLLETRALFGSAFKKNRVHRQMSVGRGGALKIDQLIATRRHIGPLQFRYRQGGKALKLLTVVVPAILSEFRCPIVELSHHAIQGIPGKFGIA